MPIQPPAKFFVNQGVVTSREDMLNLLRPLLKQTVTYRYLRGREVAAHGTGWVERIVVDQPDVSTYFTPIAITLNVDSFEHLDFQTRPDQLLVYTLVQGDESVVVEFTPGGDGDGSRSSRASSRSTPRATSRWSSRASIRRPPRSRRRRASRGADRGNRRPAYHRATGPVPTGLEREARTVPTRARRARRRRDRSE